MRIRTTVSFLILLLCVLLIATIPVSSVASTQANQEKRPAIALSTLHANSLVFSPSIYPERLFPEYIDLETLVLHDTAITSEERAKLLLSIEEEYAKKEEAYYAALSDTKVLRHTFDCATDSSYHEITLVYTKNEILRFETTTLRAAEDVVLSYSIDSPTEATLSVFVEDPNGDSQATVTFTLLKNGKLIFGSTGTSRS